jgi:hypothetical protein
VPFHHSLQGQPEKLHGQKTWILTSPQGVRRLFPQALFNQKFKMYHPGHSIHYCNIIITAIVAAAVLLFLLYWEHILYKLKAFT